MFGSTGSSKKIITVVDIGSSSAAVAIVAIHASGPATVVASSRVALPFEERTEDATAKGVIAGLSEAGGKALAAYAAGPHKGARISGVHAVINAPWVRSTTARAFSVLEKESRITSAMISALAQQAISSDTELDATRFIESAVVRVELNGYPTGAPVGKSAHRLSVAVLLSDCNASLRSGLEDALSKLFPGTKPVLRSAARALISAMQALPDVGKDYVILAVQAEVTNVLVIRGGLTTDHMIIPEGVRSIIKRISEKGLPEETLSLLRMADRDESSTDATDAIKTSMAHVELDLARVYGEGLTKIATPARLPAKLVLITHPDLASWLTKFFSRIDFTQCTLTAQPFSVHALAPKDLDGLVVAEGGVPSDIETAIAAALVNTEEQ